MKYIIVVMIAVMFSGCATSVKKTKVQVDPLANVAPVKKCKVFMKVDGLSNPFSLKCKAKKTQMVKVTTKRR